MHLAPAVSNASLQMLGVRLIFLDIASISAVEGKNWRHGDIEDMLKTIAFIAGHKWTSTMIKRVYFGNWLRD